MKQEYRILNASIYKRDIIESGQEARVAQIVEPTIEMLGYRLVRVRISAQNGLTLQIMAERPDGMIAVGECEEISRAISPVLDIEDPIQGNYHLEVSSPGIDRPMVRLEDFRTWAGHVAKLETREMVNGRKRYKGTIISTQDGEITFRRDENVKDEAPEFTLNIADIGEAKLVLSDDLIKEALRRDKALRQANNMDDEVEEIIEEENGQQSKELDS